MKNKGSELFDVRYFYIQTDQKNPQVFSQFFHPSAHWAFGNNSSVIGRESIAAMAENFYQQVKFLTHEIKTSMQEGSTILLNGKVTYHRNDDKIITLPFAGSIELRENLIYRYDVFMDVAPLFQ